MAVASRKTGHPQKKNNLLDAVQKLVTDKKRQTPFTDDRPGETWYRSFLKLEHLFASW